MGSFVYLDRLRYRARYWVYGTISKMLVEALLRARREGIRDEIVIWQIEATKRAHTARKLYEELEGEHG